MAKDKQLKWTKPLPALEAIEGTPIKQLDLKKHIKTPDKEPITFTVELADGGPLPKDLVCTEEGIFSGIPQTGTARDLPYKLLFIAQTKSFEPLILNASLKIYAAEKAEAVEEFPDRSVLEKFWETFSQSLPVPDLKEILTRAISPKDLYYLLGRFSTLTIWNGDDLSPAVDGELIAVDGASSHFNVYDFGVALVITPTDLYSTERTLQDAIQTTAAVIREIQNRGWNIEMAGYDKMMTAAWIAVQDVNQEVERLGKGHKIEIYHFEPTPDVYETYHRQTAVPSAKE